MMRHFLLLNLMIPMFFVNSSKILILQPFPAASHYNMFQTFIRELLDREHEITAITTFKYGKVHPNLTEIIIEPEYPLKKLFPAENFFNGKYAGDFTKFQIYYVSGLETSKWGFESSNVKEFMSRDDLQFDLILAEQFFQESWLMFAHKYQAPIVTYSTFGPSDVFDHIMGALTPWSFVPHSVILHYGDSMNFMQRCYNFLLSMTDVALRNFFYLPKMNEMSKEYFKNLTKYGPLPSVQDLQNNISLILVNSHWSINKPRPLMPSVINIGGSHMKPAKQLPQDIQDFLDGAENGAIYFSIGSFLKSSEMPKETLNIILKVFGSLNQKILWKYEADDIPNLPPNVMIKGWMPQTDVLRHKNVILFISHGGLYGTIEGSVRGVPFLFLPIFADQFRNAMLVEKQGYGLIQNFQEINEQNFKFKVLELINNKKYLNKAQEISKLMNDNPVNPREEAIYWIEYVIRTKGARHLKSAAIHLTWYQYLSFDVIVFILLILRILIFMVLKLTKTVLALLNIGNFRNKIKVQ